GRRGRSRDAHREADAMSGLRLRFTGSLEALSSADRAALLQRTTGAEPALERVRPSVAQILERVRTQGDAALRALARELDGVELESLEIPRARWDEARDRLDPALRSALERAARNIATFHRAQRPSALVMETEPGIELGR